MSSGQGADRRLDMAVGKLKDAFADSDQLPYRARHLVDQLALTLQAALLIRSGNTVVAEAFIASRLGGEAGPSLGTLPRGVDAERLIERADPWRE